MIKTNYFFNLKYNKLENIKLKDEFVFIIFDKHVMINLKGIRLIKKNAF